MTKPKRIEFMADAMVESIKGGLRQDARMSREDFDHHAAAARKAGFDDRVPANFNAVVRYRWGLATAQADRGICIMGSVGTGKTLALRVLRVKTREARMLFKTYQDDPVWYEEIVWGYNRREPEELAIDDLGAETTLNDYGTKLEVLEEVISARHKIFIDYGTLTHITTNLTAPVIDERYGPRLMSRIREMASICVFEGPDRRNKGNESWAG